MEVFTIPYAVAIQHQAQDGQSALYYPDALTTFDYPEEAKELLLAMVADELALARETVCTWIDADTLEVIQECRPAPFERRGYQVVSVDDEE